MAAPSTSLIIPAYNEGDRLAAGFRRLEVAAQEGRVDLDDLKVIYVDDGSRDSTAEVAASLAPPKSLSTTLVSAMWTSGDGPSGSAR